MELGKYLASLDANLKSEGPEKVVETLGHCILDFPEHSALDAAQEKLLVEMLDATRRIISKHGRTDKSLVIELMALGKLGRFEEAVSHARAEFKATPTWATAIAAGNALRRQGKLPEAIAMFLAAAELDETDVTALLEVGDLELEAGRFAQALSAYNSALKREKSHGWAEASSWYCRYMRTKEKKWLTKLKRAANTKDDECGVEGVLTQLFGYSGGEQRRARAKYLLKKLPVKRKQRKPRKRA